MSRTKRTPQPAPAPAPRALDAGELPSHLALAEQVEPDGETAADRLAVMLQQTRGNPRAVVKLYRMRDGARVLCDEMSPEEFEAQGARSIRRRFGPGKYEVRLFAPNPDNRGKFSCYGYELFELAADADDDRAPATAAPGARVGGDPALLALLERMEARLTAIERVDPAQSMERTLALAKSFREAFGAPAAPPAQQPQHQPTVAQTIKEMLVLQEFMDQLRSRREPPGDDLATLGVKALDTISKVFAGGAPGAVGELAGGEQLMPTVTTPPALAAATPATTTAPNGDASPMTALHASITQLNFLASTGTSAEAAAPLVAEKLPDDVFEFIANDPQWFERLAAMAPSVRQYEKWYRELREEIVALETDGDAAAAPGAAPTVNGKGAHP